MGQNKHQYSRKSRDNEEEDASSVKTGQDSEMIILGLFREQRQEELYKDRVNQVKDTNNVTLWSNIHKICFSDFRGVSWLCQ